MEDLQIVNELIRETGELLEPDAILYYPDDHLWTVSIDENTRVDIVFDSTLKLLVFTLDLGSIPEESARRVHEVLLRFNYLWRETGGLYAAIDDEGRGALLYKSPLAVLEAQRLRRLLMNLAIQRRLWADLINAPLVAEDVDMLIDDEVPFARIRV